jgi:hypothetical protein
MELAHSAAEARTDYGFNLDWNSAAYWLRQSARQAHDALPLFPAQI